MKKSSVLTITALLLATTTLSGCSWLFEEAAKGGFPAVSRRQSSLIEVETLPYTGFGYQSLQSDRERRLYAQLDEAVGQSESKGFVCERFDDIQTVSDVIELYKDDHPEVFWIDESEPYYYANNADGMSVELHFKLEGEALDTARETLENKAQEVLESAPVGGTDYEKELFVHDYLIDNCAYDTAAAELHKSNQVRANEQNAYGALVEGSAVCEGYARAFQMLCEKLGVTCWVIQGQAEDFDVEGNVNHIWNCVQLDESWYHVDVTWDDFEEAPIRSDRYYYFNLTTSEIEKDHIISPLYSESRSEEVWCNGFVPPCNSTKYNYFTLNAMKIDSLDDDGYGEYLAKAAQTQEPYCCFLVSDGLVFQETFDEMVENYAYQWVSEANEINNYEPQISNNCKLGANKERRVITLLLSYE